MRGILHEQPGAECLDCLAHLREIDVRVSRRGLDIRVPKKLLHHADTVIGRIIPLSIHHFRALYSFMVAVVSNL